MALVLGAMANAGDLKVSQADPGWAVDVSTDIVPPASPKGAEDLYAGTVRVFLVEPMGRWTDSRGYFYKNALLDSPIVSDVNINDGEVHYYSAVWDAADADHLDVKFISEANIMAMGVIFNATEVYTPARPPNEYWFYARYADAAAAATPGVPGRNEATGGFTHTVFIEESTATT